MPVSLSSISRRFRIIVLLAVVTTWGLVAQSFLGSIVGLVTDPTGAVVPQATVEATEVNTGVVHTAASNEVGRYVFSDLQPGTYAIKVAAGGFKTQGSGGIILLAAQTARFDAVLQLGHASETIEVVAPPPTINTENAEVGSVLSDKDVVTLPMQRSVTQFLMIQSINVQNGGSGFSIGGLRPQYTNMTIDGITTYNVLYGGQSGAMTADQSMESIRDVKVLASNNSAEYPGVSSLITSTKSGANQLHGSGFYQTDNAALDSQPFFINDNGAKTIGPELQWYGGSLGGPVYLPKIYNGRNKTFFFVTEEHRTFPLAAGNASLGSVSLPTTAFKQGDFSSLLALPSAITITDPTTGQPFPGNIIPSSRINSASTALNSYFATPNLASGSWNHDYSWFKTSPEHIDRFDVKLDQNFSGRDALSFRMTRMDDIWTRNNWQSGPGFTYQLNRYFENSYLSETHTFTSNMINEFRVGFARDFRLYDPQHDGNAVLQAAGLQGINTPAGVTGFPTVSFATSGLQGLYDVVQQKQSSQVWQFMDNVTWQRGSHNVKFGTLVSYLEPWTTDSNQKFGVFNFQGSYTGFDYADFLLGIPYSSRRTLNPTNTYDRSTNTGLFVQDSWSVSPKLTLNMGVRWEYFMPPVDKNDRRYSFDPQTGGLVVPDATALAEVNPFFPSTVIPVVAGAPGYSGQSLLKSNWKDFGPRLAFAYRATPKTVIRGGYGIYYAMLTNAVQDALAGGPFGSTIQTYYNRITNGVPLFAFPNPFGGPANGALAPGSISVSGVNPNIQNPRTQQWNLTMEHDLGKLLVARASYRGFMTTRIPYTVDLNTPPASANPNNPNVYPYPNYSVISYTQSGGIQKMNAMDLALERKFANGVTFQSSYTLTKDMTDVGDGSGEGGSPENPYNRARDMGNAAYIPRQRFTASVIWAVPFGRGQKFGANLPKIANGILGNWELAVTQAMQTGDFLTPTYATDATNGPNNRQTSGRPNCIGNWSVPNPNGDMWFNPGAFAAPALGQYGNCGVGIIVGPGLWSANIGVHKSFKLTEHMKLKLEANMMNAFNHPNPADPNMNISDTGAGGVGAIGPVTNASPNTLVPGVTSIAGERHIFAGIRLDF